MDDSDAPLISLLSDVVLPNLRAVQASQSEQIAANDRLELAIDELHVHMRSQFALLKGQLTACLAEIAALHAALEESRAKQGSAGREQTGLIH